jgi:hypothetical protein
VTIAEKRAVNAPPQRRQLPSIWWWAFGYFATYVPYAAMTKAITSEPPLVDTGGAAVGGLELLPPSVMATVLTSITFLIATGWWRYAGRRQLGRFSIPFPDRLTFLSGLCSAGIIGTTTLAYTYKEGIVVAQLLLRGGVLMLAPVVDLIARRRVKWFSWLGLALSLVGVLLPFVVDPSFSISRGLAIDVAIYLGCYFVRLQLMSRRAKSDAPDANLRYFAEEQLVSSPALLVGLVIACLAGHAEIGAGFSSFFHRPVWLVGLAIGVMSQGTGIFGGLILLDKRENTFCVPVNRASSMLAGVVGTFALVALLGARPPHWPELVGAGFIIGAIAALALPPMLAKRRAR